MCKHRLLSQKEDCCPILLPVLRQGVDIIKDEALCNMMTPMGMMWAFRQGLRCRKRGLGMFDIPCNSFTFMSSSQHQRTYTEPWGCPWLRWVIEGNCLAARSCLLIMLFICRSVFWLTENPDRSALQFFPLLEHIMAIPELQAMRIHWWGSYHSVYSSLFQFLGSVCCVKTNIHMIHMIDIEYVLIGTAANCLSFYTLGLELVTAEAPVPRHMGPHGGWSFKPEFSYGNVHGTWLVGWEPCCCKDVFDFVPSSYLYHEV